MVVTGRMVLSGLLMIAVSLPLPAQAPSRQKLQVLIIAGEGSINNIKQRTAREPVIEVRDENDRPVAGAIVAFTLPDMGASGTFADGSRMLTTTTDAQGRATARNFRPNSVEGDFAMRVTASFQGATGSASIGMKNVAVAAAAGGSGKLIAILAIVGGAAATGIVLGTRNSNDPAPGPGPTPIPTITAGSTTVGPRP